MLRLSKTLGLKIGMKEDNLSRIFRNTRALPLFTGDQDKLPNVVWDDEVEMIIKQEDPLPAEILAVILRSEVEEGV